MEVDAVCPYCGEPITLVVDEGGGPAQRYVEDCEVCCRPIDVRVTTAAAESTDTDGVVLDLRRGDD